MSAVPVPVVVAAGTSDLPSSVAFIFCAKAGPAKATVAPSASVASMVLVFDMVFSLLASSHGVSFKTIRFGIYSRKPPKRLKFWRQSTAEFAVILATAMRWILADQGMVRRILPSFVLAGVAGFGIYWCR